MLRLPRGVVGNYPLSFSCSLPVLYILLWHSSKLRLSRDKSWIHPV